MWYLLPDANREQVKGYTPSRSGWNKWPTSKPQQTSLFHCLLHRPDVIRLPWVLAGPIEWVITGRLSIASLSLCLRPKVYERIILKSPNGNDGKSLLAILATVQHLTRKVHL